MKRLSIILFAILAFAVSFTSCKQEKENDMGRDIFLNQMDMGVYSKGEPVMTYMKALHQVATNDAGTLLRIQNDNLSKYVNCKFSDIPTLNAVIEVEFKVKGIELAAEKGSFEVINDDGICMWLWDSADQIGIIIKK